MTIASLPFAACGPEVLFRVSPWAYDGTTVSSDMPLGPWLGRGRGPNAAALAVLVDDVLGYALVATRPARHWSVSAEITLDLLEPIPTSGSVRADARVVHLDQIGGFSTGRITDENGRVLAVCTQRGRYISAPGAEVRGTSFLQPAGSDDIIPWLTQRFVGAEPAETPDLFGNPLGNVHGGISLCLAALNAAAVAPDHLEIASLHIVYARPIPVGTPLAHQVTAQHQGRGSMTVTVTGEAGGRPATLTRAVFQPRERS
ncbi:MAG: thioesterase family protein [Actinomycetota bacterium]|nr:thioesterase family protein [Actinomycetota bacterium]